MDARHISRAVAGGSWERLHPGVYRLAGSPPSEEGRLVAACLAVGPGAVVSHRSAAWLLGLTDVAVRPELTVLRGSYHRRPGMILHRVRDLPAKHVRRARGIPSTIARRTLADLAAVVSPQRLDDAVDRALATRMVTVPGLVAEADRAARLRRPGSRALRSVLVDRHYAGAPAPSVLESRVLRLLGRHGIRPLRVQVRVDCGRYRLDVVLARGLAMEVDGYAFHASPEAMRRDHHRQLWLQRRGWTILRFTWVDVVHDERWVIDAVRAALTTAAGRPNGDPATLGLV